MTTRAEQRKKNRRIKRRRLIVKTIKFILIVGAIYAFIFCTPFFNVKTIDVEGVSATSPQSVITASGIAQRQHMLKVNTKKSVSDIEKLAYVKTAQIKRMFPNRVKITVQEGKVRGVVALSNGFAAIDETGKVMEISEQPKTTPVIYGLSVKKSEVGSKISIDESTPFDVILKYIQNFSEQTLVFPCASLTLDGTDVWATLENGILVYFGGKEDIDYKVAAFSESLRSAGNIESGFFDVSNPERIVYSTTLPTDKTATEENQETTSAAETDKPAAEE
ncbi:MAG: FtsQ-type POTRA domain-containing protein [Monoglobales bacterium]